MARIAAPGALSEGKKLMGVPKSAQTPRTLEKDDLFFQSLSQGGSVRQALRCSGYSRTMVYVWRKADETFAARWGDADETAIERMEEEADRRAIDGTSKPVFFKGDECGHIQDYSDTLLIFRLKAKRPHVYRDNVSLEHSGTVAVTVADLVRKVRDARITPTDSP